MAEDRKSRAGFFSLCLNTAQNPPTKHLNYRIAVADKLLNDFRSLKVSKNAILNLKGIFKFYSRDQLKAAIDCFNKVLETDINNKNAIAHMISVYQRLHMNSKAKQYKEKQEHFEEQRKNRKPLNNEREYCVGDTGQSNFLFEYYDAEALAEQGIAFCMDCYTEEDEWVRADRSLKLFEDSLKLIQIIKDRKLEQQTRIDVEQLELEVKYWLGQCYQKVHQGVCRRDHTVTQPRGKDSYREGIRCLTDITTSVVALQDLKAWAWTYLGVYFFKKPKGLKDIEEDIKCLDLTKEFADPELCFRKALKMETEGNRSTESRIRYATYLRIFKNQDKLRQAIKFLQEAWAICETDGNWFAKTMLSQVNMSMYRFLAHKQPTSDGGPEREKEQKRKCRAAEFLNDAIKYGEEALVMNTTAMDLANVAEAYHLRGLNRDHTIDVDSDDAMQAAEYFWQAVQCLGTEKKPEIHRKHGMFLKAIGEDRQAIECFKRGMEVDIPEYPTQNFNKLFQTFLEMYSKEREDIEPGREVDDNHQREAGQIDEVSTRCMDINQGTQLSGREARDAGNTAVSLPETEMEPAKPLVDALQAATTDDKTTKQSHDVSGEADGLQVGKNGDEASSSDQRNSQLTGVEPISQQTDVGIESTRSTSSSDQRIFVDDLELDNSSSSNVEVPPPLDNTPKTNVVAKQSQETWAYKQNVILYEMAYWYQYATRNFQPKELTKCTRKFINTFQEEMSMIHAYLALDTDGKNRNSHALNVIEKALIEEEATLIEEALMKALIEETLIEALNEEALQCGESANKGSEPLSQSRMQNYKQKVDHAKNLLTRKLEKEQAAKKESEQLGSQCMLCSRPYPEKNLSRQNSTIPDVIPRPRNTYYKYDFYVIFSRSERDWVYYSLLQKLEKSYQFKGAIPERDYRLGHSTFAEMERCIKESLKVLIVLSSNVNRKEENKGMYEIDFALTLHQEMARGHYIIPVLKDDDCLPPRQLSTLACVNAVQSNAWEKIVRALENK